MALFFFTNSNRVYLGDPVLEPVFEELERRKAVVYVHPNPSPDAVAHSLGLPDNLLDFPTDTNRAVAQMHYTNRFARTPNVEVAIFSHAGGSIPYLAARFAIIDEMGFIPGGEQRGSAADMFRRIYWDTALAVSDPVLRMLRDVAGLNQVLYGTDFPYLRRDLAINSKQRILQRSELNDLEKCAILGGNASRLFPAIPSVAKGVLKGVLKVNATHHPSAQRGRLGCGCRFAIGCHTHEGQVRRNRWPRSVQRHHGTGRSPRGCDFCSWEPSEGYQAGGPSRRALSRGRQLVHVHGGLVHLGNRSGRSWNFQAGHIALSGRSRCFHP